MLTSLKAHGHKLEMRGTSLDATCDLRVWIPEEGALELTRDGITHIHTEQVPGGWIVTGCAQGTYELRNAASKS